MAGFTKLCVPTDLEPSSEPGLAFGAELARAYGLGIVVVHVTSSRELPLDQDMRHDTEVDDVLASERRRFDEIVRRFFADLEVEAELLYGDPVLELLDAVARHGCDGIVITVKNRSRVGKLLMGSKAQEILLRSPVPVIAVPREGRPPADPASPDRSTTG